MQRLQGLIEYRFVEPWIGKDGHQTWRHPFGYKFTIIRDQAAEDAHAERIDNLIARCRSQVRLCAELGHFAVGGCGKRMDNEWQCERLLRLATEVSRSKERTMLIRVEVELTRREPEPAPDEDRRHKSPWFSVRPLALEANLRRQRPAVRELLHARLRAVWLGIQAAPTQDAPSRQLRRDSTRGQTRADGRCARQAEPARMTALEEPVDLVREREQGHQQPAGKGEPPGLGELDALRCREVDAQANKGDEQWDVRDQHGTSC